MSVLRFKPKKRSALGPTLSLLFTKSDKEHHDKNRSVIQQALEESKDPFWNLQANLLALAKRQK